MKKIISYVLVISILVFSLETNFLIGAEEVTSRTEQIDEEKLDSSLIESKHEISNFNEKNEESGVISVTFDPNGGNLDQLVYEVDYGTKLPTAFPTLPVPQKEGYIFKGWYIDEELKHAITNDASLTYNRTFYAYWDKILDTTKLSDDLLRYLLDKKDFTIPFGEEEVAQITDFELPYLNNSENGQQTYHYINDYTGIEYFEGVSHMKLQLDFEKPVSKYELESLSKMPNVQLVAFEMKIPDHLLNSSQEIRDWYIINVLSKKENISYFESEVVKYLMSLTYTSRLGFNVEYVSVDFDYSLNFADMSFLSALNQRDEPFMYDIDRYRKPTVFFESFEVVEVDNKTYYKISFENPFLASYLSSNGKQVLDSQGRFIDNLIRVDYNVGNYEDYTYDYYEKLDEPIMVKYLDRDNNLIEGNYYQIEHPEFFNCYEVFLSEDQMADIVRQYYDTEEEDLAYESPTSILRGDMRFRIPQNSTDENGEIDDENIYFEILYDVYIDLTDLEMYHNVNFNTNGGTDIAPIEHIKNRSLITNPGSPMRVGYKFSGWYYDDEEFSVEFTFETPITRNLTLYAKWEESNEQYNVNYEENGGTEVADLTDVETGTKLTEPTTTKAGYTFEGWYRDADFTTAWNFDIDLVETDVTLYAKWEAIPVTYTVTYEENGGTEVVDLTDVAAGTKLTEPTTTKVGYTFKGWYRDADFTTAWNFDIDLVETDVTLYAKWEAIPVTYTVTYEENGGTEVVDLTDVAAGTKLTEPTTTKVGYTFKGWYRDAGFTTAWNFAIDLVESDVTLYAKWEAIPVTYTVTYEENGGTEVDDLLKVSAGTLLIEPITQREGFTFAGWYSDPTLLTQWNFAIDAVNSDITLFAKWNEKSIDPEVKPEPEVTEPETQKPEVKPEPVEKLPETGVSTNLLPMAVATLGGMIVLLEMIKKKKDSYENKH